MHRIGMVHGIPIAIASAGVRTITVARGSEDSRKGVIADSFMITFIQ